MKIIVRNRMLGVITLIISLTLQLSINLENFNLLKCKFNYQFENMMSGILPILGLNFINEQFYYFTSLL